MKTFGHSVDRLPYHCIFGHIEKDSDAFGFQNFFSRGCYQRHHDIYDLAKHEFCQIDPKTGHIKNCIDGHELFKFGGKHNDLGDFGKMYLEHLMSGKCKKKIHPFIPPSGEEDAAPPQPAKPKADEPKPAKIKGSRPLPPPPPKSDSVAPVKPKDVAPVKIDESPFIQKRDECLKAKKLFEDPEFPPTDSSLYFTKAPTKPIKWMRPGEIIKDPQLIVQGNDLRFDVIQGELGDCWFLAATACLTLRDELFYRVVPPDQSFTENYAGIFRFHFWHYGKWVEVVIDDRLPTYNGQLIFMHSEHNNEFWSALLEKAYAKLFGSYEAIDGGMTSEALEDFTGGLIEIHETKDKPPEVLMGLMLKGFEKGSFFSCSIDADPNVREAKMTNGLIRGHAYSITAVKQVQGSKGSVVLVRIRNPWGDNHEWKGPWSDGSWEWSTLSEDERKQMQVNFLADGEFWMAFDDFIREFKKIEICHFSPEIMDELDEMTGVEIKRNANEIWNNWEGDSAWSRKNGTAGGCRNYISKTSCYTSNFSATFANNPQFYQTITIDPKNVDSDGKISVIAAVMQKYRREGRKLGLEDLTIGFGAYTVTGGKPTKKLDVNFFQTNRSIANTTFTNLREVSLQFRVAPGTYVLVPSTFDPNQEAEFLIRVYAEGDLAAGKLN